MSDFYMLLMSSQLGKRVVSCWSEQIRAIQNRSLTSDSQQSKIGSVASSGNKGNRGLNFASFQMICLHWNLYKEIVSITCSDGRPSGVHKCWSCLRSDMRLVGKPHEIIWKQSWVCKTTIKLKLAEVPDMPTWSDWNLQTPTTVLDHISLVLTSLYSCHHFLGESCIHCMHTSTIRVCWQASSYPAMHQESNVHLVTVVDSELSRRVVQQWYIFES